MKSQADHPRALKPVLAHGVDLDPLRADRRILLAAALAFAIGTSPLCTAGGIYYRALVGPFASPEKAARLCSGLKAAGGDCIIEKN